MYIKHDAGRMLVMKPCQQVNQEPELESEDSTAFFAPRRFPVYRLESTSPLACTDLLRDITCILKSLIVTTSPTVGLDSKTNEEVAVQLHKKAIHFAVTSRKQLLLRSAHYFPPPKRCNCQSS